jgi:DNA-binding NarL/FixJ family response regulator
MIRVLIAEDHHMVRAGICALLEKAGDFKVVGEASDGQEAVDLAEKLKPDVLVMDIMMPRINGVHAAERIRDMNLPTHILLLSMYSDESLIQRAMQSGVKGYVLKTSVSDELISAVRCVARGETFLSKPIEEIFAQSKFNPQPSKKSENVIDELSPREKEILQLIAEEHTSSDIASLLFISEKTVEKHRANIMTKLNTRNVAGLVRLAVKYNLVEKNF